MWIQILLIAAIVALGFFVMRRPGSDSHLALRRLGFGAFVIAAVLAVLFPEWLSWLASLVGVGRGTDLLLYALVVVFLVFVFTQYRRNVATGRQLTLLARRIALQEALSAERIEEASGRVRNRPSSAPAQPEEEPGDTTAAEESGSPDEPRPSISS